MKEKKYTLLQNMKYYFTEVKRYRPIMFLMMAVSILISVAIIIVTTLIPTVLISLLTDGKAIAMPILLLSLGVAILSYNKLMMAQRSFMSGVGVRIVRFSVLIISKFLSMDYEQAEIESIHKAYMRSLENGTGNNSCGTEAMYTQSERLIVNTLSLIVFGALLTQFNPLAFLLTLAVGILNAYLLTFKRQYREKTKPQWSVIDSKRHILKRDAIKHENGKDARIYNVQKVYMERVDSLTESRLSYIRKEASIDMKNRMLSDTAILIRDLFVFIYLINGALSGAISIATFTLFFTMMTSFNVWIQEIVDAFHLLNIASQDINDVRTYLEIPEASNTHPISNAEDITIQFHNVSYRYPNASHDTLANLNFTLNPKESIALVGVNGAGKSTIVKLILGLIKPTTGTITLNGEDITQFERKAYFDLFAPAFQENDLWALTLQQNVSMSKQDSDTSRMHEILVRVGLGDVVDTLPKGILTNMTTNIHLDGTSLSGGQIQKLMLARALYKDAPIMVLDEPTAALDAIAEQNMYEQYQKLAGEKSSIFISHRLSSTRFCDRILFLENGVIVEEGTHSELLKAKGYYADMFAIQSQYYQKEDSIDEESISNLSAHSEA
ncbi:ABC transporter ATP-binding protein [Erysipelothrix sp. HDW6C]|uniref:ABC transporter ATP-binding protein n=1 Tax=Erysipelothrix sp. HDW6C TaxID=2714930 RepID=UPI001408096C|nr:ABC transporter ATP-binding protein [Erysipelothrix sp. HDW6C]QIK70472.1 ABC transporter ATP-binding protein [Erysipelothrix sp. HDW6C]